MTRILLVMDNAGQAAAMRRLLEGAGFVAEVARDGVEAVALAKSQLPDAILSDVQLPRQDGFELCARLKADPQFRSIPVVLMATRIDPTGVVRSLECGAESFITKHDPEKLLSRIRVLIEKHSAGLAEQRDLMAIEFLGKRYSVRAGREQVAELLISTFEDVLRTNEQLQASEAELNLAKAKVEDYARQLSAHASHLEDRASFSEEKYRALVEHAPDGIAEVAPDGTLLQLNPALTRMTGFEASDVIGRSFLDFVVPSELPRAHRAFAELLGGGTLFIENIGLRRKDGRRLRADVSASVAERSNGTLLFAIIRDITDQIETRARLQLSDRMASVGTLAAGVAHEINNPLASVIANVDLVLRDLERKPAELADALAVLEEMKEPLKDAREAAERVRLIVRDMRVFSRADETKMGPIDVVPVLETALRMAQNEIRHRARLVTDFRAVPSVDANEARLGQVFLNLIVNAAQALPDRESSKNEIRVGVRESGGRVVVDVGDNGVGIPDDVRPHIFDPFFTTKPVGVGTGLGLAICHRLITEFGGDISVETTVGEGSTFRVALPASKRVAAPTAPQPAVKAAARRGTILVVDDETTIGTVVRRTLAKEHDVVTTTSAREALDRITAGDDFDVILCDLMMPEMTGMELHAEILRAAPHLAERMVFLTGGAFTPRAREFLEKSPNVRVDKPFDPEQLRNLVNERIR